MATKKPDDKDAKADKPKDGKDAAPALLGDGSIPMTEELVKELAELTSTQRAAVLMLLTGMGTLMPTMPTCTWRPNSRATLPSRV